MARPPQKPVHGGPRKPLAIRLKEGTMVTVFLPRENHWFTGAVKKYDTKKALHTLENDAGDFRRVDLRTVRWKLYGIEECTAADIEAALDRRRRWLKSQSAEFLESMNYPRSLSPRERPSSQHLHDEGAQEGAAAESVEDAAWDGTRLRVRKEDAREWDSSSEGDSGENEGALCSEDEDEAMDGAVSPSCEPPVLVRISGRAQEEAGNAGAEYKRGATPEFDAALGKGGAKEGLMASEGGLHCDSVPGRGAGLGRTPRQHAEGAVLRKVSEGKLTKRMARTSGHVDFHLSTEPQLVPTSKTDGVEKLVSRRLGVPKSGLRLKGRRTLVSRVESPILKRPVGRPPKVRKGYAAIKYAQDIAARAINRMARDKLCNFTVIPSTIPFVEELQLIFGISRRLKVDRQKMLGQEGTELAAEVLRDCRMAQEPVWEREDGAAEGEGQRAEVDADKPPLSPPVQLHSDNQNALQSPSCMRPLRADWSRKLHSPLVV